MYIRTKVNPFILGVLVLLGGLIFPNKTFSQTYGNEWIKSIQTYYRFSIPKTGMYKITNQQLLEAGIPLGGFSPQNIQLFYNGEEIPCYIEGESQGQLEYIIFYAKKNTGWFDVEMYDDPSHQTNANHSVITDTASVFFTWNKSVTNKRFSIENDVNFVGYTPQTYCWANSYAEYTATYYTGLEDCEYVEGEGWFDNQQLNLGGTITKNLSTPNFVNVGVQSSIELAFVSFSKDVSFSNTHHINVTGPGYLIDTSFNGYRSIKNKKNVNISTLDTLSVFLFKSIDDKQAVSSKVAISYINFKYTRGFAANSTSEFKFSLPAKSSSKSYIEISGFTSGTLPYLFDIKNGKLIKVVLENGLYKALVPSSTSETDLILLNDDYFLSPAYIVKTPFINHSDKKKDYLIISHPNLWQSAQDYETYRNAYLVSAEELYNQFGYGIQKHPMAIRNYLNFVYHNWSVFPKDLFIIGKAVESYQTRYNAAVYNNCLVPTMGQFGSDVLLSNRIGNNGWEGAIPTGRLAAQTNEEVLDYLNKVQEFEANKPNEWMKRAIHFGGGASASEQNSFKNYLETYEKIFEDSLFGGFVSTFLKTSSDPIVISKSDSIKGLVNGGVSLMTFFGHGSAANGFDQNIDEPDAYENMGKYPVMLTNSCYSGNIHLNGKASKSEDWVLIKNKGAISFLAVVGSGYTGPLNIFSTEFYNNLSTKSYGKTIGEQVQASSRRLQQVSEDRYFKLTIHEFTLHGDPKIILNSFPLPDLTVNSHELTFIPNRITTEIDSFQIQIVCTNQSRTTNKKFTVEVERLFATKTTSKISFDVDGLFYKDTVKVKLPVDKINGLGNNIFTIRIDANNTVEEEDPTNNTTTVNTYITSGDLVPVIPYKYSIKPVPNLILKASSVDAFASEETTNFQIDTSYLFNSPLLFSETIHHTGGIIEWTPQVSIQVNNTYFWRVAKNSEEKEWAQSSFFVNKVKQGWHQSNYGQLRDNTLQFIEKDDARHNFTFSVGHKTLRCDNLRSPSGNTEWASVGYSIDGATGYSGSCGAYGAMLLVVFDSLSLQPWLSNSVGDIGQGNYPWCSNKTQPESCFIFYSSTANIEKMVDFVNNEVPNGNYVLIYSFISGNFTAYNEKIRSAFDRWLGDVSEVRYLSNTDPYIFFTQKGNTSLSTEVYSKDPAVKQINLNLSLPDIFTYGLMTSSLIGPAKSWSTLNWSSHTKEENPDELAYIELVGIDNSNTEITLEKSIYDNTFDLSSVDAQLYPYLKLIFQTKDETYRTPSSLDSWEVLYEPVTDLAINPQKGFLFESDSLQEGEKGRMAVAFENIGIGNVDSTVVNYWIQNDKNEVFPLYNHAIAPLKTGEIVIDTIEFSTLGKPGNQSLWVELNPASTKKSTTSHREQYYFNNLAQKPFYVQADASNPMLDVTFDGMHIMDGDLVSANPEIVIQLKDENQFILLNDTSLFSFYIKSQATGVQEKISINNNPDVVFLPAKSTSNKAQIIYNSQFPEDGIYELRVQAKDKSGNESGAFDFVISFQVINESTITNVFNYPNPFSTSTRFVFELTGSELPEAMRIEILTVTGKVIKVIYMEELGALHIGKNISDYAWDGTDMYGDPLAIGVYFYRVNARLNGKELKIRDTGTNQYFKNGFGKMYLMR